MKIIYCAGEQGRVVLDVIRRSGAESDIVFLDDDKSYWGADVKGVEVAGGRDRLAEFDSDQAQVIVAYGDSQNTRLRLVDLVLDRGFDLFSALDPSAVVAESANIDSGVFVNAQSYIGPNTTISEAVLLDSLVSISHDVVVEEGVTVGPNATIAGGTHVEADAFIGAGATLVDDVAIGAGSMIGAGAVVVSDVPAGTVVTGVPASEQS